MRKTDPAVAEVVQLHAEVVLVRMPPAVAS
jgi:hypothetical protein